MLVETDDASNYSIKNRHDILANVVSGLTSFCLPSIPLRGTGRVTDSPWQPVYLFRCSSARITTGNHDACFGIYGKGSECITHPSAPHCLSNGHSELFRNFHCKKKQKERPAHTDLQQVPSKVAHWESPRLQPSWESPRLQPSWKYWTDCHDSNEFGWLPLTDTIFDIFIFQIMWLPMLVLESCPTENHHNRKPLRHLQNTLKSLCETKPPGLKSPSMWRRAGKRCTVELVLYH